MCKFVSLFSLFSLFVFSINIAYGTENIEVHYQDRRPEMLRSDSGSPQGPIIEIAAHLLNALGLTPSFRYVPWARSLRMAQNNADIFLIRHSMPDERRLYLDPIVYGLETRHVHFYKRKGSNVHVETFEDLYKYNIGMRRKSFYFSKFQTDPLLSKVAVNSDDQMIRMLMSNRIDLIIFNQEKIFIDHLKAMDIEMENKFEETQYKHSYLNPRFFSIPKESKNSKLYQQLNCKMYQLRKSGFITETFQKYNLMPPAQKFTDIDSLQQVKNCI